MALKAGAQIWIPCEVKPGPFSNERLVKVESAAGEWVGFVNVDFLEKPVDAGMTRIKARVITVEKDRFFADLPGNSFETSKMFQGDLGKVATG